MAGLDVDALSHVVVFGVVLAYANGLAKDTRRQHGKGVGYAVLGAVVILPTILLGIFNWKMAAAAWVVKAAVWFACEGDKIEGQPCKAKLNS